MKSVTYDPEKFNLTLARLKKGGQVFEIVVDPELAIDYKESKKVDVADVLKSDKIFANAQRGLRASETVFEGIFGTTDSLAVAKIILDTGELQLTAEHRRAQLERKRKQIIGTIHRFGVDPRTGAPHTLVRIDTALNDAKIHIDEFKSSDLQVKEIIRKLQPILPLRFEIKEIEVVFSPKYAHTGFSYLKKGYTIIRGTWGTDNSWTGIVEVPGGLEDDFTDALNSLTHGTVQMKVIQHR